MGWGSSPARREQYLELRRAGTGREEAARELGLDPFLDSVRRYERWFAAEGGEADIRRPWVVSRPALRPRGFDV